MKKILLIVLLFCIQAYPQFDQFDFLGISKVQNSTVPITLPTVITSTKSVVDFVSVNATGNAISDGGSTITEKGVCWGTSVNPTITGSHVVDGVGTGSFISTITSLDTTITYHYRAFATNSAGTGYGSDSTFTIRTNWLYYQIYLAGNVNDGIDVSTPINNTLYLTTDPMNYWAGNNNMMSFTPFGVDAITNLSLYVVSTSDITYSASIDNNGDGTYAVNFAKTTLGFDFDVTVILNKKVPYNP